MLNVVILAAGRGSRIDFHTQGPASPLGEPLLGYVIRQAQQLTDQYGGTVRVVTGFASDQVDPYVESLGLEAVHQTEQLGTSRRFRLPSIDT